MKIIIRSRDIKISTGHPARSIGTGIHSDKRSRRNNTRSSQQRKAIRDFSTN
jgi:hypothetical protein